MKRLLLTGIGILFHVIALNTSLVHAGEFNTKGGTLYYSGTILPTDVPTLRTILESNPRITTIVLNSTGGNASAGVQMAYNIKATKIDTYVHRQCSSACSFLWLAGESRRVHHNGNVDNHGTYLKDNYTQLTGKVLKLFIFKYTLLFSVIAPDNVLHLVDIATGDPKTWVNLNHLEIK